MIETLNFLKENQDAIGVLTSILTTVITLLGAIVIPVVLARVTGSITHQNSLALQLNEKKKQAFEEFISTLWSFLEKDKEQNDKEVVKSMLEFKKKLMLNASEETLSAFNDWTKQSRNAATVSDKTSQSSMALKSMDRLIYSLRKDIGVIDQCYSENTNVWSILGRTLMFMVRFIIPRKGNYDRVQLMLNQDFNG